MITFTQRQRMTRQENQPEIIRSLELLEIMLCNSSTTTAEKRQKCRHNNKTLWFMLRGYTYQHSRWNNVPPKPKNRMIGGGVGNFINSVSSTSM